MQIPEDEITTKEVLSWQGLHLLHFAMSSCSQKVRILLDEKSLDWTSHPINLAKGDQRTDWYRGINAKTVVPVLVHDGRVYNESNDILRYLDETFPSEQGSWFPETVDEQTRADALLDLEDDLHHDLKVITFSYVMPGRLMNESFEKPEIEAAAKRMDEAFRQLEEQLEKTRYLCGDRLTLPDIAWFITLHRLVLAGYNVEALPKLSAFYDGLLQRPAFNQEINRGGLLPWVIGKVFRGINNVTGNNVASVLQHA